jgi:hypothetical protein
VSLLVFQPFCDTFCDNAQTNVDNVDMYLFSVNMRNSKKRYHILLEARIPGAHVRRSSQIYPEQYVDLVKGKDSPIIPSKTLDFRYGGLCLERKAKPRPNLIFNHYDTGLIDAIDSSPNRRALAAHDWSDG